MRKNNFIVKEAMMKIPLLCFDLFLARPFTVLIYRIGDMSWGY